MNAGTSQVADASWRDLFWGANAVRVLVLAGGVALHAINLYLTTTILPSVVDDIGGVAFYAWNTTLFVVASIIGAAMAAHLIVRTSARGAYVVAAAVFGAGSVVCAIAPSMPVMLVGRLLQGLGGGLLLSTPYVLMRSVLPERLWPQALALLSGMWGIATLLGPAVGGAFAQYAHWRLAFWSLVPLVALFAVAAVTVLRTTTRNERPLPMPGRQLLLLAFAVLVASWSSVSHSLWLGVMGLGCAVGTFFAIRHVEMRTLHRILPAAAFAGETPLGKLYGISALLAVTVTCTEIFVPLFLQRLHGQTPLVAGYIAATASAGWTAGSVFSASLSEERAAGVLRLAPWACAAGLLLLAVVMPLGGQSPTLGVTTMTVAALTLVGLGVGMAWPHLANGIMTAAPPEDHDRASASIMTVQLVATALGAALGGVIINSAGAVSGDMGRDMEAASQWLFLIFAGAPLAVLMLYRPDFVTTVCNAKSQ